MVILYLLHTQIENKTHTAASLQQTSLPRQTRSIFIAEKSVKLYQQTHFRQQLAACFMWPVSGHDVYAPHCSLLHIEAQRLQLGHVAYSWTRLNSSAGAKPEFERPFCFFISAR